MKITIPGKPIAKKRPRFFRRGKGVGTYNDQQTEEGRFLALAMQQIDRRLDGPLAIDCVFYMPRPQAHFGTGKNAGKLKPTAPDYPTGKPDLDNMEKFVADCLNGEAWADDRQIVYSLSVKLYADDGHPRTEIEIREIANNPTWEKTELGGK